MLVLYRFRVAGAGAPGFLASIADAHEVLARQTGYVSGNLGRNIEDPELWILETRWENLGSYRRALSNYDVKMRAMPALSNAIEEASAFEIIDAADHDKVVEPNRVEPRTVS